MPVQEFQKVALAATRRGGHTGPHKFFMLASVAAFACILDLLNRSAPPGSLVEVMKDRTIVSPPILFPVPRPILPTRTMSISCIATKTIVVQRDVVGSAVPNFLLGMLIFLVGAASTGAATNLKPGGGAQEGGGPSDLGPSAPRSRGLKSVKRGRRSRHDPPPPPPPPPPPGPGSAVSDPRGSNIHLRWAALLMLLFLVSGALLLIYDAYSEYLFAFSHANRKLFQRSITIKTTKRDSVDYFLQKTLFNIIRGLSRLVQHQIYREYQPLNGSTLASTSNNLSSLTAFGASLYGLLIGLRNSPVDEVRTMSHADIVDARLIPESTQDQEALIHSATVIVADTDGQNIEIDHDTMTSTAILDVDRDVHSVDEGSTQDRHDALLRGNSASSFDAADNQETHEDALLIPIPHHSNQIPVIKAGSHSANAFNDINHDSSALKRPYPRIQDESSIASDLSSASNLPEDFPDVHPLDKAFANLSSFSFPDADSSSTAMDFGFPRPGFTLPNKEPSACAKAPERQTCSNRPLLEPIPERLDSNYEVHQPTDQHKDKAPIATNSNNARTHRHPPSRNSRFIIPQSPESIDFDSMSRDVIGTSTPVGRRYRR